MSHTKSFLAVFFAFTWGLGSCMYQDSGPDERNSQFVVRTIFIGKGQDGTYVYAFRVLTAPNDRFIGRTLYISGKPLGWASLEVTYQVDIPVEMLIAVDTADTDDSPILIIERGGTLNIQPRRPNGGRG